MAASQSRRLDASAKPYVWKGGVAPPPATPQLYMGPPAAALPPAGFYYPRPVLVAPPAPVFPPGACPGCWGFPQGPCVGVPGAFPSPGWAPLAMGVPAAPAGMQGAPQPQLPAATATRRGGRDRPSRCVRAGHAPRARPLPRLDVPPRMMQRAAGRAAPPSFRSAKVEPGNDHPSPRSVLVQMSPPDTPPALPTSFPYPEVGSAAPRASEGSPSSVPVPAAGSQPDVPPRRRRLERAPRGFRQAAGVTVRRSDPKPRRLFDPTCSSTTLMIRNIPNDFRRTSLMQIIDQHCSIENDKITSGGVKSEYDFLYLPIDFRTGANKGYAFVNLTTPEAARRLHDHLNGHRWKVNGSGKTCEVDHADIEGLEKLVKHFWDSRFDCGDEEFLPVWFEPARDGTRTTLPHLVGRMLRRS
ncbi:protein MEI2-like 6 [Panicum miliaceum]|uniref:Protein MEI2-like 6 n=1 Tax=Panicum miliaceum TaxID=4540 RepID=A0A3L6QPA8_PANMI|nr:protein MEI2-like 6 [Panicum miliaceum]